MKGSLYWVYRLELCEVDGNHASKKSTSSANWQMVTRQQITLVLGKYHGTFHNHNWDQYNYSCVTCSLGFRNHCTEKITLTIEVSRFPNRQKLLCHGLFHSRQTHISIIYVKTLILHWPNLSSISLFILKSIQTGLIC